MIQLAVRNDQHLPAYFVQVLNACTEEIDAQLESHKKVTLIDPNGTCHKIEYLSTDVRCLKCFTICFDWHHSFTTADSPTWFCNWRAPPTDSAELSADHCPLSLFDQLFGIGDVELLAVGSLFAPITALMQNGGSGSRLLPEICWRPLFASHSPCWSYSARVSTAPPPIRGRFSGYKTAPPPAEIITPVSRSRRKSLGLNGGQRVELVG